MVLLDAAFAAFATAVQTGYGFGALLLSALGLGVLWLLRHTLDATEEYVPEEDASPEAVTPA